MPAGRCSRPSREVPVSPAADRPSSPARRWPGWLLTAAAIVVVQVVVVLPDRPGAVTAATFLRIPIEAVLLAAVLLALPARLARAAAVVLGVLLAVLTLLKVLNLAVETEFHRPFDPLTDPGQLGSAVGVLADSVGDVWSVVLTAAAVLLIAAAMAGIVLAVRRLARCVQGRRRRAGAVLAVLAGLW